MKHTLRKVIGICLLLGLALFSAGCNNTKRTPKLQDKYNLDQDVKITEPATPEAAKDIVDDAMPDEQFKKEHILTIAIKMQGKDEDGVEGQADFKSIVDTSDPQNPKISSEMNLNYKEKDEKEVKVALATYIKEKNLYVLSEEEGKDPLKVKIPLGEGGETQFHIEKLPEMSMMQVEGIFEGIKEKLQEKIDEEKEKIPEEIKEKIEMGKDENGNFIVQYKEGEKTVFRAVFKDGMLVYAVGQEEGMNMEYSLQYNKDHVKYPKLEDFKEPSSLEDLFKIFEIIGGKW